MIIGDLEDLKAAAQSCKDNADKVHASFDLWKNVAMELYAACCNDAALVEQRQFELQERFKFAQTVATESKTATETYGKFVTEMQKHYEEAKDEYKNQLHDFPGA